MGLCDFFCMTRAKPYRSKFYARKEARTTGRRSSSASNVLPYLYFPWSPALRSAMRYSSLGLGGVDRHRATWRLFSFIAVVTQLAGFSGTQSDDAYDT